MNIVCVLTNPFPDGFGATPFMKLFCKGLLNQGVNVTLICHYPPPPNSHYKAQDTYDGINVFYTYRDPLSPKVGRVLRKLCSILPALRFWIILCKTVLLRKTDYIEFHSYGYDQCLAKLILGVFYKIIVFHGEYPNGGRPIKNLLPKILCWTDLHLADLHAFFMINSSSNLTDFYSKYVSPKCKFIQIPLLIDCYRFENHTVKGDRNFITYCGDFGGNKDGVPDLLKAFSMIAGEFPDIKLKLIGSSSDPQDVERLKNFARENDLSDRVIFTGPVPHSEMPDYLGNSRILALARPNNRQAHGGFPSKLGEYLATGVPCVITRVGVIDQYFEDEKHLFFAEPDDPEKFAQRLRDVLNNPDKAAVVAKQGQAAACEQFDYNVQVAKIIREITAKK